MLLIKMAMIFFFAETENSILKCIWNLKGPLIDKTILKKNKVEGGQHFLISKLITNYQNSVTMTQR